MGAHQIPGSGPNLTRLHSGRLKSPIHTATTDAQRRRDVGHRASGFEELHRLVSLEPRRWPPPQVPVLRLRLGDPLTLTLKHHLAFELREAGEDSENKLASRALGVDRLTAEVENAKSCPSILDCLKPLYDLPQAHRRSSQPVDLGDDKRVAGAHVVQGAFKLRALCDRRDALLKYFGAASQLEVPDLGMKPGLLVSGR